MRRAPYPERSNDLLQIADSYLAAKEAGQIRMLEDLPLGLKTSHRLGADIERQADDLLGHIVGRIGRIVADFFSGPLHVLEQLVDLPQQTLSRIDVSSNQPFQFIRHRRRTRIHTKDIQQLQHTIGLQRTILSHCLAI